MLKDVKMLVCHHCVTPLSVASVSCDVKGMGDKRISADTSKP